MVSEGHSHQIYATHSCVKMPLLSTKLIFNHLKSNLMAFIGCIEIEQLVIKGLYFMYVLVCFKGNSGVH